MSKNAQKPKLIVILGPTATGKSSLAVHLAKKFGGEIVSADSRQIYRGLDIGTEKITHREMRGVPHHLLDVASPRRAWSIAQYQKLAHKVIRGIVKRGKVPFLVGGTGFYISAIIDNRLPPPVKPDAKYRKELDSKSVDELFSILTKLDPDRARAIEQKNKRRLIRALEITRALGKVPPLLQTAAPYSILQIGLDLKDATLKDRIETRLNATLKRGLVQETKWLRKYGLSWKRIDELGLEYKIVGAYLRDEIMRLEMIEKLRREIWNYAKRQRTWFKRDKQIKWFNPDDVKDVEKRVDTFLSR